MLTDQDLKGKSYLNTPLFDGDHENDKERPKYAVQSNMSRFLPKYVVLVFSRNGLISCGSLSKPLKTTF